ncbi:MAG: 4Fe-4S dicluster domain-containing protein [Paracoccus sp. (in: a-proteobacteria)]|nr:4Fe-4S dicluster domain-containing protein [Paracoccus sp. (in: a-proteobacteria)]
MSSLTRPQKLLICDCQGTIPLDQAGEALRRACPSGAAASEACRGQLDAFRGLLDEARDEGAALTVACTAQAPLFAELAGEEVTLRFANIRETAGWSDEGARAGPKMAALIAMAEVPPQDFAMVSMESRGVALILGADEVALEVAQSLASDLDITLLMWPGAELTPPGATLFPIWQGRVSHASGHLGAFRLEVDDFAAPAPSSRGVMRYGPARDGAVSQADLVIDLTGRDALFAEELRPGYLRAGPGDSAGVARLTDQARQMVGTFDKPQYINFRADLCAHSRNRITGCTRCLDLCPAGAITPAGDTVAIDPMICAGCGQCATACPTGAAGYALPGPETVVAQLRAGLDAYHLAADETDPAPVILFHDGDHGAALIDALAHHGPGLPARVIPFALNEVTRLAPEIIAAAMAYGASVAVLTPDRPRHDLSALRAAFDLVGQVAGKSGLAAPELISTDDPDRLAEASRGLPREPQRARSGFLPPRDKRGLLVTGVAEMIRHAPAPEFEISLERGAPFGTVTVDPDACVLCHACTAACPSGALSDNPEMPELAFTETACVQCGICAATCPESAITLTPRISLAAWDRPRRVLHAEPPFACVSCGTAFATASGIARVRDKLAGHWMFSGGQGAERLRLLEMCENCRAVEAVKAGFDPHQPG